MLPHELAGFYRHEKVAANIHFNRFVVGAEIGVQHMSEIRIGGGIVHTDVQFAVCLAYVREELRNLIHRAHIAGKGLRAPTRLANLVSHCSTVVDLAT